MGKRNRERAKRTEEQSIQSGTGNGENPTTTGREDGGKGTNSGHPDTTDRGDGGRGTGAETGAEEKKRAGLVLVDEAPKVPTPNTTATPKRKPKKVVKKPTKEDITADAITQTSSHLQALLGTVSHICAVRGGLEHWALRADEIVAISEPAARILSKLNLIDKLNDYGDYMALGVALSMAVIPRVMIHNQVQIHKKQEAILRASTSNQSRQTQGNDANDSSKDARPSEPTMGSQSFNPAVQPAIAVDGY